MAVPKRDLQNAPARVDLRSAAIAPGQTIESAGSPGGSWPNMFRGHVVDVRGNLIEFVPQPKQGRSGSAMVDLDGRNLERVTFTGEFDGFPMWAPDGRTFVFCSNRHSCRPGETNVFVTTWRD